MKPARQSNLLWWVIPGVLAGLATYFITQGAKAEEAIQRIRAAERTAIETPQQIQFLELLAHRMRNSSARKPTSP